MSDTKIKLDVSVSTADTSLPDFFPSMNSTPRSYMQPELVTNMVILLTPHFDLYLNKVI